MLVPGSGDRHPTPDSVTGHTEEATSIQQNVPIDPQMFLREPRARR